MDPNNSSFVVSPNWIPAVLTYPPIGRAGIESMIINDLRQVCTSFISDLSINSTGRIEGCPNFTFLKPLIKHYVNYE